MRFMLFASILSSVLATTALFAEEKKEDDKSPPDEKIVTPVEGVTTFAVTGRSTLFRISLSTISGGTIEAPKISGSAKLVRSAEIVRVNDEGKPTIGALEKEFVFRGTAAGKVTISFKKTLPTQPMPVVETYTITIK